MSYYREIESRFIVVTHEFVRNASITEKNMKELGQMRKELTESFKLNKQ